MANNDLSVPTNEDKQKDRKIVKIENRITIAKVLKKVLKKR